MSSEHIDFKKEIENWNNVIPSKYIEKAVIFENTIPLLEKELQVKYKIDYFKDHNNLKTAFAIFKNKEDAAEILKNGFFDALGTKIPVKLPSESDITKILFNNPDNQEQKLEIPENFNNNISEYIVNLCVPNYENASNYESQDHMHTLKADETDDDSISKMNKFDINERILYFKNCNEISVKTILSFLKIPRNGGEIADHSFNNNTMILKVVFKYDEAALRVLRLEKIQITKDKSVKIVKTLSKIDLTLYVHNVEEKDIILAVIESKIGKIDISKAQYNSNEKSLKIVLNNFDDMLKLLNEPCLEIDEDYVCKITTSFLKEPYILYISYINSIDIALNILPIIKNLAGKFENYEYFSNTKILHIFFKNHHAAEKLFKLGKIKIGTDCEYIIRNNLASDIGDAETNYSTNSDNISLRTVLIKSFSEVSYFEIIKPLIESQYVGGEIESYKFDKETKTVEVLFYKKEAALSLLYLKNLIFGTNNIYTIHEKLADISEDEILLVRKDENQTV